MLKVLKNITYYASFAAILFLGTVFLLNIYSSEIVSCLIGEKVSIGAINYSNLLKGELVLKNIILYNTAPYENRKAVIIKNIKVDFDINTLLKLNKEINAVDINGLNIFYIHSSNPNNIQKLGIEIIKNLLSGKRCNTNWNIDTIDINNIYLYCDTSHHSNIYIKEINQSRTNEIIDEVNLINDFNVVADNLNSIYTNPLHYLTYPRIFYGNLYFYELNWSLLHNESISTDSLDLAMLNYGYDVKGKQIGVCNISDEGKKVVQIGLFNISRHNSGGIQFGLINYMDNGILPICPLINFSV
jgi:hypothetical protein